MFTRAPSVRHWLLLVMIASALIGLAAAYVLFNNVQNAGERSSDYAKARQEARAIATQIEAGAGTARLRGLQELLSSDRITVKRGGRIVFQGPPRTGRQLELQVQARLPAGVVRLADYTSSHASVTAELELITAGVLALVIAAAIIAATLVSRAVRDPVERAIDAAERVSHGDFSARMGTSGPGELVKLGSAFDDMAARLEQTDRNQRQFLADVAHEIATPVNAISGFALALAEGTAEDAEARSEAKSVIDVQTARLRDLLSDLRRLTGLDLAQGVRVSPVSLRRFGERLVASFWPVAREANLALRHRADDSEVLTDARLLEMIASNLLSNAIRYTPTGGAVRLELRHRDEELTLSVRDTGVGIAPEHQKHIFERLYRVDSTRDRATGGSGLGLAIVHRAVQTLGGQIDVDSTLGQGSEFCVRLPAQASEPTSERPSQLRREAVLSLKDRGKEP